MKITELSQFEDGMLVVRIRKDKFIKCHGCVLKTKIKSPIIIELYKSHNLRCTSTSDGEICSSANFTYDSKGEIVDYYESYEDVVTGVLTVGDI